MDHVMNRFLRWLTPRNGANHRELKSTGSPFFTLHDYHEPVWSSSDYGTLAREGYSRNPIVYRCVRMISEAAALVPFLIQDDGIEHSTHPALDLLMKPNHHQAGQSFLERIYGHLLVSGNAYIEMVTLNDVPRELYALRPDCLRMVRDDNGWPSAYEYSVNHRTRRFTIGEREPEPILHLSLFNPLDEFHGLPPLSAAHMAFDIHNASGHWNKALLDNSARPSGALVYGAADHQNMTDEQFSRLKRELEDGYSGASRAGRPLLLEGGLDWKAMGYSPKDMDFLQARNGAARDIALAFGVPPMLLGIPGDNTYANYKEANKAFWYQTILPLVGRTCGSFENWFSSIFGAPFTLTYDPDRIEVLASEREATWKRVQNADFLTNNEKREAVGYQPISTQNKSCLKDDAYG